MAAVLAAAISVSAAGAAVPRIGGFSARPARFDPSRPATQGYFIEYARPGHRLTDQAVVTNDGHRPIRLRVYPVDGLTGVTSGTVFGNSGQLPRKAGRWVTSGVSGATLAPGAHRLISFAVRVPADAVPGDHVAGIVFENAQRPRSGGRFSITQIIRVGLAVVVEVPGRAQAQVRLDGVALHALAGTKIPAVIIRLGNAGRRLCKPALAVSLVGPGGRRQPVVRRQLDTILPGDAIPFPLPWPRPLRPGTYSISAAASRCGRRVALRGVAQIRSALGGTKAVPGAPTQPSARKAGDTPWLPIVGVGVGGLLLGALVAYRLGARRTKTK